MATLCEAGLLQPGEAAASRSHQPAVSAKENLCSPHVPNGTKGSLKTRKTKKSYRKVWILCQTPDS